MKRHHEDNPYCSTDSSSSGGGGGGDLINHSLPKRFATRSNSRATTNVNGNYSPPNSIGSDSSSSTTTTLSSQSMNVANQLCTCPSTDCVVHLPINMENLPSELTHHVNPIYANKNLLLYYAHLERCRRYGNHVHQYTSSS